MQRVPSGSEKFLQRLSSVIYNLRYILIGLLGAIVVLVITWAIVSEVRTKRIEDSTVLAERAQDTLDAWVDEEDEAQREQLGQQLLTDLERIIDQYPRLYAAQRAYEIRGSFYFRSEQFESAAETFLQLAAKFPKSYLAPVSIINAAVSYEEAEKFELAFETYRRIIDEYGKVSPEVPRILFALGRLSERIATREQALEYYNRLVDEHGSSSWTNLARDRIIYLNLD